MTHSNPLDVLNILIDLQSRLAPYTRQKEGTTLQNLSRLTCTDGLSFSCQASDYHYCTPRDSRGPWNAVELGFPNRVLAELEEYAEDWSKPTDTVYADVPLALVAIIIHAHGGLAPEPKE